MALFQLPIMNLSKAHQIGFVTAVHAFFQHLPDLGKRKSLRLPWLEAKAQSQVAEVSPNRGLQVLVSVLMGYGSDE